MRDIDKLRKCFKSIGVPYEEVYNSCWDTIIVGSTRFNFRCAAVGANADYCSKVGELESVDTVTCREERLDSTLKYPIKK